MSGADEIDCYAVLGVPRDATPDQIRSEWRRRQARYASDEARLRQIDAAAGVLLNAAKRAALDDSLRKREQRSAAQTPASDPDSLDFTGPGELRAPGAGVAAAGGPPPAPRRGTPTRTSSAVKKPGLRTSGRRSASDVPLQKTAAGRDRDRAGGSRKITVAIVVITAIATVLVFALTRRAAEEGAAVSPSATPPAPAYRSAPADKPAQPDAPPAKRDTPPAQAPAPPNLAARAIPPDFLRAFGEYTQLPGSKAIALAVDQDGRWAYGTIARHATQTDANEEALAECMRFKAQSGVRENCRLYAIGDEVVW